MVQNPDEQKGDDVKELKLAEVKKKIPKTMKALQLVQYDKDMSKALKSMRLMYQNVVKIKY